MGKKQKKQSVQSPEEALDESSSDDASGDSKQNDRVPWWMTVGLIAATVFVYANSMWGVFVFDDVPYIVISETVRRDDVPRLRFDRLESRPLMQMTLWGNYQISQLEPWSYHIVNIFMHIGVGLLFFRLTRETLRLPQFKSGITSQTADGIAFAATLVWLVHPLTTQAVTYTVQRGEIMMSFFYLGILYSLLRTATTTGIMIWVWGVIGFASAYFGLFSKQVIVTAPVVALLYDYTFLSKNWGEFVRRRSLFYLAVSIPSLILVGLVFQPLFVTQGGKPKTLARQSIHQQVESDEVNKESPPDGPSAGFGLKSFTKWEYFRTQPEVLLYYLSLAVFPYNLSLDYLWTIEENYVWIAISGLCILSILVVGFYFAWKKHWLGFLILTPFFILTPTSSIVPINDLAVEHRMYLPLAFLCLLAVVGVRKLLGHCLARGAMGLSSTQSKVVLLMITVLALGTRTIIRNTDYYSREQMWKSVIEVSPYNARAYTNLGKYYLDTREPEKAIPYYQRAHEIVVQSGAGDYEVGVTLRDVGSALHDAGQLDQAFQLYSKAIALTKGQDALAFHSIGKLFAIRGDFEAARKAFEKANQLLPDDKKILTDLANLYGQQRLFDEAIPYFHQAKRLDPDNRELRMNLIRTLLELNRLREAITEAKELLPMLEPGTENYLITKGLAEHQPDSPQNQ